MKPSELFCFKETKNLAALLFFLAACNNKFQQANATYIEQDENVPPDDRLICITCSVENNAFSVLHYVMVALHYSMLHRFEIFSALGTIAHGFIRLPPRSLARWQLQNLGTSNTALIWFESYLTNGQQSTRVATSLSERGLSNRWNR